MHGSIIDYGQMKRCDHRVSAQGTHRMGVGVVYNDTPWNYHDPSSSSPLASPHRGLYDHRPVCNVDAVGTSKWIGRMEEG